MRLSIVDSSCSLTSRIRTLESPTCGISVSHRWYTGRSIWIQCPGGLYGSYPSKIQPGRQDLSPVLRGTDERGRAVVNGRCGSFILHRCGLLGPLLQSEGRGIGRMASSLSFLESHIPLTPISLCPWIFSMNVYQLILELRSKKEILTASLGLGDKNKGTPVFLLCGNARLK